jgi:hypothetical protein
VIKRVVVAVLGVILIIAIMRVGAIWLNNPRDGSSLHDETSPRNKTVLPTDTPTDEVAPLRESSTDEPTIPAPTAMLIPTLIPMLPADTATLEQVPTLDTGGCFNPPCDSIGPPPNPEK